eukprot:TRINITY_DN6431_c0_g2_i3.p1 TRINITY_DN6431_c0_g2~~TRINITY_DN6431_c0_g2_i3.p1  ORF type:complete len:198 (-),score=73.87 TRINITY_DN6431_c0_g2_i3:1074-1667(-)
MYTKLLQDQHYIVYGAAVYLLSKLCRDRLDLIHPVYLLLCENLEKMEDAYLPSICATLTSYCKAFLLKPTMSDTERKHLSALKSKCKELIAYASNGAAIASFASLLFHIGSAEELVVLERPLLRLLSGPEPYKQLGLNIIQAVLQKNPEMFESAMRYFRIFVSDTEYTRYKKVEILKVIANERNIKWIQKELEYWIG